MLKTPVILGVLVKSQVIPTKKNMPLNIRPTMKRKRTHAETKESLFSKESIMSEKLNFQIIDNGRKLSSLSQIMKTTR